MRVKQSIVLWSMFNVVQTNKVLLVRLFLHETGVELMTTDNYCPT